jgi:radical SAM enzyme (TIGR01210 family)
MNSNTINIDYSKLKSEIRSYTLSFRNRAKEKVTSFTDIDINKPVSSWIKEDRLLDCIGYEFVIILRTCACHWARSQSGGCSMCGYYNDATVETVNHQNILNQFNYAIQKNANKLKEIEEKKGKIALKLFTSGSFLDPTEISYVTQEAVFREIVKNEFVSEIVIESRPEFINEERLKILKAILGIKHLIIGIGLESSNKYVREIIINKGFNIQEVASAIQCAHSCDVKIKTYLLLKPPFLTEKIAIRDAVHSINDAIDMKSDIISLNPVNVQSNTLVEYLYNKKRYRSPWIFSVIRVFQLSLNSEKLKRTQILCDPSAAGKEKGVHNCESKECNATWLMILKNFIFSQDYNTIKPENLPYDECKCFSEYCIYLDFE